MNAIDFEYDGQYLSDYGFIICDFNGSSGADSISAGSALTFNKVSRFGGKLHSLTSTQYDECITTTFDICKDPDVYDDMEITGDEFRDLMRWLNRREFLKFQIHDSELDYETCYFEASFNIEKIKIHEVTYGLRLNMETNKPFGYGIEQRVKWTFHDVDASRLLSDISDEIGSIYPSLTITCGADGDLQIYNDFNGCTTEIKNCTNGEVITIDGDTQIISSSLSTHKVYEDFNYEFFKIGNTYNNRNNRISVSKACTLEIRYTPIIKDLP